MNSAKSFTRRFFLRAACATIALALCMVTQPASAQTLPATAAVNPKKPALFLIGDSTIRNGSLDNGATAGQFGWGHMLHYYFDTSRIYVVNDAMGGTSSRSFQTSPNLWPLVLQKMQPGDFIIMAFGHNDSSASIRGNGDETQPFTGRGATPGAVMHSFGWYMRQYIEQARDKGATPIVCSLIPRNRWNAGKVNRNTNDYSLWAKQAADQDKALYFPLNDMIADKYDKLGMEEVQAKLFPPNEAVHPNWAGAKVNAETVVEGIKALKDCPLKDYLLADPKCPDTPDIKSPARGEMGPTALAPVERPTNAPASAPALIPQ